MAKDIYYNTDASIPEELRDKMPKRMKSRQKKVNRSGFGNFLIIFMLALVGIFMALPLYYSVICAFKPLNELFIFPPRFYVVSPTLDNFRMMWTLTDNLWVPLSRYIFNSVFTAVSITVLHVIFASMAGYVMEKHRFPGRNGMFNLVQFALLFTGGTMAIPQYVVMALMGMINTYWAVILPAVASSLGLFLMKQFMVSSIPDSMLEAAKIDGANEFTVYWKIVMPNVKPAWLTIAIFAFQSSWNATGGNMIYSESMKLLPTALNQIFAADATGVGNIARTGVSMAVSLILIIPPIVFFVISQSNIMETMSHSGMKD